MITQVFTSMFC